MTEVFPRAGDQSGDGMTVGCGWGWLWGGLAPAAPLLRMFADQILQWFETKSVQSMAARAWERYNQFVVGVAQALDNLIVSHEALMRMRAADFITIVEVVKDGT